MWRERKPTGVELRSLMTLALGSAGELVAGCEDLHDFACSSETVPFSPLLAP